MSGETKTFEKAAEAVRLGILGTIPTSTSLLIYGLYKQSTIGDVNVSLPRLWDRTGREKWSAWNKHKGKTKEDAMVEYITLISELKPNWAEESTSMSGAHHSTMVNNDAVLSDSEKGLFDWVKENNAELLEKMCEESVVDVPDEEGLSLCHWAADRGHVEALEVLLKKGADPNKQDDAGQTPLHFAACCGHREAVKVLLRHGADMNVTDSEGDTPRDVSDIHCDYLFTTSSGEVLS